MHVSRSRRFLCVLALFIVGGAHAATTGTVSVAATTVSVAQPATHVAVELVRTGGSSGTASVAYGTHTGTAMVGHNYAHAAGTVTWSAGDAAPKTLSVTLEGVAFSGDKSFSVVIHDAQGAALGSADTTTVTIEGSEGAAATVSTTGTGPAAKLAAKLGRPARLLVGVGAQGGNDVVSAVESQADEVDIYDAYLGSGDWTRWNSAPCNYVCVVAGQAEAMGAIPMYTQYQMANDGDGNISVIDNAAFMATYWARVRLLFQTIAAGGKPALVNLEPDFWGYVEQHAPGGDPTKMTALVSSNADCAGEPNTVTGLAGCLIGMARKYAPKAYVGFPPANWGGTSTAAVVAFMNELGAQKADFIVEQALDRDSGCFEVSPQPSYCSRSGGPWYWDETNETHPNFQDNLNEAGAYHQGIGDLPVVWWQIPEGVPSTARGGTPYHYRDDRMHYFLTHPAQLVAVGGLAVVFSTGENHQTSITTDAGQFQLLDSEYFRAPAKLP